MADIPNQPTAGAIPNNLATGQLSVTTVSAQVLPVRDGENASNRGIRKSVVLTNTANNVDLTRSFSGQVVEGATAVTTGDGKMYILMPSTLNGWDLTRATAAVVTAGTTGNTTIQIARIRSGATADMLSTLITIASGATVATIEGGINAANDDIATNDVLRVDIDSIQSGAAPNGLVVTLEFQAQAGVNTIYVGPSGSENFAIQGGKSIVVDSTAAIFAKTTSGNATLAYAETYFTTG